MSITVLKPNGEAFDYRKVSERLPAFLEAFPLDEGYRIVRSHSTYVEKCPGLTRLYEAAINQGKSIYEAGLPELSNTVIFEAALYHNSDLIANASSAKVVVSYKDWECGETAAFQRLMAACGFGGELLDIDGEADLNDQNLRVTASDWDTKKANKPRRKPKKSETPVSAPKSARADANAESAVTHDEPASTTPQAPVQQPVVEEEFEEVVPAEPIQSQLITVLNQLARGKGVPVPQVRNNQEARAAIQELKRAG
ncbi:hypothetical protein [Marinobacter goseongensis]|uniref:hypothetical protein n=1 Tax=Marinobacter goseongensis TaxID=453838 RepID=UPI0020051235|nr:hypothetical protein [Marinobacter goseongensis]MCK7553320.1 hypothetical protein [Marinobacter goseongensis]